MSDYYVTIVISHIKVADILKGCGYLSPSQAISRNVRVEVVFETNVVAYQTVDRSRAPLFDEIAKQYDLDQKYDDSYTPSAIMEVKPYICLKFQAPPKGVTYDIEKDTSLKCSIVDISPYFKRVSLQDTSYLIRASDYLQSQAFCDLVQSVDKNVLMAHGLYGTVISLGNRKVILTNGYRCLVAKTTVDANMYEMLYLLWNDYMTRHADDLYTEKVMRFNNVDNGAYIMLNGCAMENLIKDVDFLKGLLKP